MAGIEKIATNAGLARGASGLHSNVAQLRRN